MKLWRRSAIVTIGFIESLIFSGCLFGWTSLLYVLEREGVYSHLCANHDEVAFTTTTLPPINTKASVDLRSKRDVSDVTDDNKIQQFLLITDSSNLHDNSLANEIEETTKNLFDVFVEDLEELEYSDADYELENFNGSSGTENGQEMRKESKCNAHIVEMTLIYTVAAVSYGLTSILIGFALESCGLWFTRFGGCIMTSGGFFFLAFTSKEMPWLLWPALNLIALGSSQLRLSSFQFANLWPQQRTTVLIAYSSAYSISTTLFLLIQFAYNGGIPYRTIVLFIAFLSLLSFPVTMIMPKMRIEDHIEASREIRKLSHCSGDVYSTNKKIKHYDEEDDVPRILKSNKGSSDETVPMNPFDEGENPLHKKTKEMAAIPLKTSLWTLSALLHTFWHFINIFLVLFYSATFMIWVHKMTDDPRTFAHYNEIAGLCALVVPIFIPISGIITDWQIRKASKLEDRVEKLAKTMQAPAYTMAIASLFVLGTMICKVYFTKEAVYVSLVLISISRPFIVGSCTSYIRIRFHPSHFNRLNGIFTTVISIMSMVQYPIILWMKKSTEDFVNAQLLLIALLVISLISPGHMMITSLARKYAQAQLQFRTDL